MCFEPFSMPETVMFAVYIFKISINQSSSSIIGLFYRLKKRRLRVVKSRARCLRVRKW